MWPVLREVPSVGAPPNNVNRVPPCIYDLAALVTAPPFTDADIVPPPTATASLNGAVVRAPGMAANTVVSSALDTASILPNPGNPTDPAATPFLKAASLVSKNNRATLWLADASSHSITKVPSAAEEEEPGVKEFEPRDEAPSKTDIYLVF